MTSGRLAPGGGRARVLVAALVLGAALWIQAGALSLAQGAPVVGGDTGLHLCNALAMHRNPAGLPGWADSYPPAAYVIAAVFLEAFGPTRTAVVLSGLPWLVLLLGAAARLGWRLGGPVGAAATVAVLACTPWLETEGQWFLLDLPLAASVAAAMVALLESEGFTNRRASLAFGALLGLALLVKYTAVYFLLAPALAEFARLRGRPAVLVGGAVLAVAALAVAMATQGRHALAERDGWLPAALWAPAWGAGLLLAAAAFRAPWNAVGAALLALALAGPFYVLNAFEFYERGRGVPEYAPVTLESLLLLPVPGWLVLGLVVGVAMGRTAYPRDRVLLLLGILGGIAANWATGLSATRYFLPIYGLLAPLAVGWVGRLGPWGALPVALLCASTVGLLAPRAWTLEEDPGMRQVHAMLREIGPEPLLWVYLEPGNGMREEHLHFASAASGLRQTFPRMAKDGWTDALGPPSGRRLRAADGLAPPAADAPGPVLLLTSRLPFTATPPEGAVLSGEWELAGARVRLYRR